jgi:hypothetical protein
MRSSGTPGGAQYIDAREVAKVMADNDIPEGMSAGQVIEAYAEAEKSRLLSAAEREELARQADRMRSTLEAIAALSSDVNARSVAAQALRDAQPR